MKEEMTPKPTVLIVDDSPMMCRFLGLFLEKKFDVISYTDSTEALAFIKSGFSPDIIVTDLEMPQLNGIELMNSLRGELPQIPVLVVSGAKESSKRIHSLNAGADDFLMKPFHPAELEVRVSKLMTKIGTVKVQKPSRIKQIFSGIMKNAAMF